MSTVVPISTISTKSSDTSKDKLIEGNSEKDAKLKLSASQQRIRSIDKGGQLKVLVIRKIKRQLQKYVTDGLKLGRKQKDFVYQNCVARDETYDQSTTIYTTNQY